MMLSPGRKERKGKLKDIRAFLSELCALAREYELEQ